MSAEVAHRLALGLPLLALWVWTSALVVRHPVAHWERAGRDKRFWAWAHVVCLLLGVAPVASTAFLVGVWPRLHRAARDASPQGPVRHHGGAAPCADTGGSGDERAGSEGPGVAGATGEGVLALRRGHDGSGGLRRLAVVVDGRVVARLRPGGVTEVTLPAQWHVVQARMDWLTSAPLRVRVRVGATVRVAVALGARAAEVDGLLVHPETAIDAQVVDAFSRW